MKNIAGFKQQINMANFGLVSRPGNGQTLNGYLFSQTQSLQGSSGNFEGIFYQMGLWFSEDFPWTNIKEHPPACLPEKVRKGNNDVLNIEAYMYSGIQKLLHILFLGPLAQN